MDDYDKMKADRDRMKAEQEGPVQQLKQLVLQPNEDITTITGAEAVRRAVLALEGWRRMFEEKQAAEAHVIEMLARSPQPGGMVDTVETTLHQQLLDAAPLQAMSAEDAAQARPAFKQALPSLKAALKHLDDSPIALSMMLMSPETARGLGLTVPEEPKEDPEPEELRMGDHVRQRGRVIDVALWYPDQPRSLNAVEISLVDVRASDGIQIQYDKQRDGWSIRQASTFEWDADDDKQDMDWQEVAFIQAWAREKERET